MDADFAQFVEIAYGSAMEVASDSFLALDERYITETEQEVVLAQVEAVASKASGLYRKFTNRQPSGPPLSALRSPRRSAGK